MKGRRMELSMSGSAAIKAKGTAGDAWGTPQDLFTEIKEKYFHSAPFDPCPNYERLLQGASYFPKDFNGDGLKMEWGAPEIFVNPPFSKIEPWVKKAHDVSFSDRRIILLLPARTDQFWFNYYAPTAKIVLIRGRVNYIDINSNKKSCASFGSMLMIFGNGVGIDFWWPDCHRNRRKA